MKDIIKITLSVLLLFSLLLEGCNVDKHQKFQWQRLIFNCDGNGLLACPSVEAINKYVDDYANSQVTIFMICSGSDFFHYRSKYGKVFGDEKNYLSLEKDDTDMISAILRRVKEGGMEAFNTCRLNDLYFTDTAEKQIIKNSVSGFWRNYPEYWVNENEVWHSKGAFDFAHKEVRERKLGIITEQLKKYGSINWLLLSIIFPTADRKW